MSGAFDLGGKIALVTGASRGIGEAIARTLAAHGAHVVVSSRKAAACACARAPTGTSADAGAAEVGNRARQIADIAWRQVEFPGP